MWNIVCGVVRSRAAYAGLFLTLLASGCDRMGGADVALPRVDAQAAAQEAVRLLDTNSDGMLSAAELVNCPSLASVLRHIDQNSDQQLSPAEIAGHLERVLSTGVGLLEVRCIVTRGGRPLAGATVRCVPEPFLGDAIQTAVGTSDADGLALPSVPVEQLPKQLRNASMMQVGLYRVEVEHPSLTGSERKPLGFEVDPTRRDGTTARFHL